jgi:hypothetical protein
MASRKKSDPYDVGAMILGGARQANGMMPRTTPSRASRVIAPLGSWVDDSLDEYAAEFGDNDDYEDSCSTCGANDMDCECSDGYMRRGLRSL